MYSTAKLFFSYGLQSSMIIPLATGASVVLDPERFAPERAWGLIARERPTVLYAVPTAYAGLLAAADAGTPADVASLRCRVRGPSTAQGYHASPERTAATFRDGWVVTGDRYQVRDGRYRHLGRDDDMLRVGAQWVSPLERPRWVEVVPELPKTATGKVQRYRLRQAAPQA